MNIDEKLRKIFESCPLAKLTSQAVHGEKTTIVPPYGGCLPLIINQFSSQQEIYNCSCPVRDFIEHLQLIKEIEIFLKIG